ncbi:hypothetical protein ACE0DR_18980 [Azotobacter sp. CWF10]
MNDISDPASRRVLSDEEKRPVVVLLIPGQRQSIEQQLIHHCLMLDR